MSNKILITLFFFLRNLCPIAKRAADLSGCQATLSTSRLSPSGLMESAVTQGWEAWCSSAWHWGGRLTGYVQRRGQYWPRSGLKWTLAAWRFPSNTSPFLRSGIICFWQNTVSFFEGEKKKSVGKALEILQDLLDMDYVLQNIFLTS